MSDPQTLYYYNERGYLSASSVFTPGATTRKPLATVPDGKTQRWNGHAWEVSDPDPVAPGGGGADRELLTTTYRAKSAFTGASVGDTITATRVLDVTGENATQVGTTIWFNETTAAVLGSAPSAVNLETVGTPGLSDAQLRAAAVPVSNTALGAPADAVAGSDTGAFSLTALYKRMLQGFTSMLGLMSNPAVVTATLSAATAAPVAVADLVANSYAAIAGGTVDALTARLKAIAGGTATVGFYATDDDVNLFPIEGIPVGGGVGTGSFTQSATAAGAWALKGSGRRKVYIVAVALSGGATADVSLSGTPNQARVTSVLRGSKGGSISEVAGTLPTELVGIQGAAYVYQATVNRANNQTPYIAADVVGGIIEFQNIGPAGGHIVVTSADLLLQIGAVPAGMSSMKLALYNGAPASNLADNAPWTLATTDRDNFLGFLDIGAPVLYTSNCFVQTPDGTAKQYKLAAGQTSLWGYLITSGGFTPAAGLEVYKLRLRAAGM